MNYAGLAATALRLLREHGRTVTHRVVSRGPYNVLTGEAAEAPLDIDRKGAVFPVGKSTTTIRGSLVKASDIQVLLEPSAGVEMGHRVVFDTREYEIISIGGQNPAGIPLYYDLHLREVSGP